MYFVSLEACNSFFLSSNAVCWSADKVGPEDKVENAKYQAMMRKHNYTANEKQAANHGM